MYATSEDETQRFEEPKPKAMSKEKKPAPQPRRDQEPRKKKPTKPKNKSKPRQQQIPQDEMSEEEYTPYQTQYGKSGYKAPGMNKRFAHQSYSPKRQHVQQYQEDFSDLAVSKKIHFNPRINKDKMEEAEFLRNLSSDDEMNRSMSRERMEKEISLFRMYLNLKKRYNKDPKRFLRIFRIYFAKDAPVNDKID